MTAYLPWWVGAAALALVTVGSCIVARRPLGVSGILARFANVRGELRADRARAEVERAGDAALEAAMLAATLEAFGPAPGASDPALPVVPAAGAPACAALADAGSGRRPGACRSTACGKPAARPTIGAHALFLAGIVAGGFVAAVARGGFALRLDLGPDFAREVGRGGAGLAALAVGGLLVGIGTSVSGGCSTGHGLSGMSRLQPAGVAATATFFATAVACSLLLEGVRP